MLDEYELYESVLSLFELLKTRDNSVPDINKLNAYSDGGMEYQISHEEINFSVLCLVETSKINVLDRVVDASVLVGIKDSEGVLGLEISLDQEHQTAFFSAIYNPMNEMWDSILVDNKSQFVVDNFNVESLYEVYFAFFDKIDSVYGDSEE